MADRGMANTAKGKPGNGASSASKKAKLDPSIMRAAMSGRGPAGTRAQPVLSLGPESTKKGQAKGAAQAKDATKAKRSMSAPKGGSSVAGNDTPEAKGSSSSNLGVIGLVGLAGLAGVGWLLLRPSTAHASTDTKKSDDTDESKPKPSGNRKFGGRIRRDGPQPRPSRPTTRPTDGPPARGVDRPTPTGDEPTLGELVFEYPEGGGFYQAVYGDTMGGIRSGSISRRFLLSEGYLAAKEYGGLSDDDARAWAADLAARGPMRVRAMDLIQCSGWNDALYGAEPRRGTRVSPHGRSILLLPRHATNAKLLAAGESPVRNIRAKSGESVHGDWRKLEFLWLPAIDRRVLWESSGETLTTAGQVWPDGNTKHNPPTWVMSLGIIDESDDLDSFETWGCPDADGELAKD